jgi:hypothetical protein
MIIDFVPIHFLSKAGVKTTDCGSTSTHTMIVAGSEREDVGIGNKHEIEMNTREKVITPRRDRTCKFIGRQFRCFC